MCCCRYEQVGSHMLGYKGRKHRKPWKKHLYDISPETRYMDLTAFPISQVLPGVTGAHHLIAAACSDGYVRSVSHLILLHSILLVCRLSFVMDRLHKLWSTRLSFHFGSSSAKVYQCCVSSHALFLTAVYPVEVVHGLQKNCFTVQISFLRFVGYLFMMKLKEMSMLLDSQIFMTIVSCLWNTWLFNPLKNKVKHMNCTRDNVTFCLLPQTAR